MCLKCDRERIQAAQQQGAAPDQFVGISCQSQIGHASHKCTESNLTFQPGQRSANTGMYAFAKGQMLPLFTRDIKLLRIGKVIRSSSADNRATSTRSPL